MTKLYYFEMQMTRFEPRMFGVRSNRSTNNAKASDWTFISLLLFRSFKIKNCAFLLRFVNFSSSF